ncbi:GNAT domain-containing protein [Penicillium malachiteum]|uniref:GNAT domain-containing protein n=1 Tax=Penicillium malachiteum TaxID=1324776 RepID=UPI0025487FE0|nr:GNAT domain-containing protein [Penicillium malachiteum]KAJ5721867.1 GNAT domain-containing protein [Penicillium malachiteum]
MELSIQNLLPSYSKTTPIYTTRLILRPFQWTDLESLHKLRTAPEVMQWTSQGTIDSSTQQTRDWMQNFIDDAEVARQNFNFVVTLRTDNSDDPANSKLIGVCGLVALDSLPVSPLPILGYMFLPEAWGKGYATETVLGFQQEWRRLVDLAQQIHSIPPQLVEELYKIRAITLESNVASAGVLRKCGWAMYEKVDEEDKSLLRWILDQQLAKP